MSVENLTDAGKPKGKSEKKETERKHLENGLIKNRRKGMAADLIVNTMDFTA